MLTSERAKTASGAIALFHRPAREDPLETGQAFYRAWLTIERLGLAACPVSVLADWPEANRMLVAQHARSRGTPARQRLQAGRCGGRAFDAVCPLAGSGAHH
ncbi:hypothetical protein LJR009_005562 [Bosea sp. LjRoot9]|uniref:hypothetical protein n=1 Tax=Bosea sp. LjRoot9 TaxID=3342341 RepID=UPI003ECC9070